MERLLQHVRRNLVAYFALFIALPNERLGAGVSETWRERGPGRVTGVLAAAASLLR